jgi:phosphoribosylformimino-5-aminoimidazole carboxamide ribotide isomerase
MSLMVTVIPAIDILGGRCVRLLQGDYAKATVYAEDPASVATDFARAGAKRIHVVDLDAALGDGNNRTVIRRMLDAREVELQVAGGIRSSEAADAWLEAGARAVVMGTAAVRDPELLEQCARRHPGRLLAALDVRQGKPAVSGWTETEPVTVEALVGRWNRLPLAGVILTCIDRDGTMAGPDLRTLAGVREMTRTTMQYSGGVSSLEDIGAIAAAGADGIILGKALYEGRFTLEQALAS